MAAGALLLLAFLTLPSIAAHANDEKPVMDDTKCHGFDAASAAPSGVDAASLAPSQAHKAWFDWFAQYAGFVDVYYYDVPEAKFEVAFVGVPPPKAAAEAAAWGLAVVAMPEEPAALGPGLLPSADDILCSGQIRPGTKLGSGCTLAFLYTDGSDYYASTAGHCFNEGARAILTGVGPFGTVIFSTGDGGVGHDYALIRVDESKENLVNAEMCDWGGPMGPYEGPGGIAFDRLVHTGHGQYVSTPGATPPRPREYVGAGWGVQSFSWYGGGLSGDSGSAVRTVAGAQALGVLTHSLGLVVGTPTIGYGTRWDHGLDLAADEGITGLSLLTTPNVHLAH